MRMVAMAPASFDGMTLLRELGAEVVRSDQFLFHYDEFGAWAATRHSVKMEDFYRWQRVRLGYLMDADKPAGGRWNFDADNRARPPRNGRPWPEPLRTPLDALDWSVSEALPASCWGREPDGTWATSRRFVGEPDADRGACDRCSP